MTQTGPTWPDRARVRAFCRFIILFWLCFIPVWFLSGWYCTWKGDALVPALAFEHRIPFIPVMIVPYLSLPWMFLLPLFHGTPEEMARTSRRSTAMIMIAGLIFVLLPTRLSHPPVVLGEGVLDMAIRLVKSIDTVYLAAPSLHVAFAVLLISEAARRSPRGLAALYGLWLGLLALSTLLVHQHHLLDIIAGAALAIGARRFIR